MKQSKKLNWIIIFSIKQIFLPTLPRKEILKSFFIKQLSYFLHQRPCVYCTILLLALFSSTCYWGQGRCWLDTNHGHFLEPRTIHSLTLIITNHH
ncbi:unnamed protein product [Rhizophagus irregularis]|nr:unnamed protein product [Rhizophagus irregularis]CAB4429923.1 unnamed protein product [Rhizophagus irregularis]